jgi:hypothetical protein
MKDLKSGRARPILAAWPDDQFTHECGGSILTVGSGGDEHSFCNRCGAYRYTTCSGPFPNGINKARNQEAWDNGKDCSPMSPTVMAALDARELNTVLAALRYWQRTWHDGASEDEIDIASVEGSLSADEIDMLCERLNTGD